MFREMRRKKQELSQDEIISILKRNTSGVLALSGEEGFPYAVPLSYVYHSQKLYFHCASSGHKLDLLAQNERVSFCVIDQDEIIPQKLTTCFQSVILFGRAQLLTEDAQKRAALSWLAEKYAPDFALEGASEIQNQLQQVCVIELCIAHMTGKKAIELMS